MTDQTIPVEKPRAPLDRVRDALTKIDSLGDDAWAAWERDADMFEQGRSDAYFHAHTIITEALGDTP